MGEPKAPRRRRWLRLVWLGLLGLAGGLLAVVAVAILALNSSAGLAMAVDRGLPMANGSLNGELQIEGASGHLLSSFELRGVTLRDAAGAEVVAAETIRIQWHPWSLVHSHVDVTELAVSGARGTLVQGPDGLNLIGILPAGDPDAPKKELPVSIEIQRAALDGVLTYDADGDGERPPYALEDLDLAGSFAMAAGRIEPRIQRLGMRAVEPPLGPLTLSGFAEIADGAIPAFEIDLSALDASVRSRGAVGPLGAPELDLNLVVEELQPERLAPLAELPLTGPLGLDADIRGPLTALQFVADLTAPRGGIHLDVTTDVKARPLTYAGTLDLDQLDLASFLDIRIEDGNTVELPSDLSGRVEVDAQGTSRAELSGTLALDLADSRWRDYEVDRLVLQAAIAPDLQVTFDRLSVQAPMGGAELHGRVRVPEQRFAVAGTLADVDLVGIGARTGVAELGGVAQGLLDAGGGWGGASGFWIEGDGQLRVAGLRTPATRVASLTVAFDAGYSGAGPSGTIRGAAFDAEAGGVALRDLGFAVDLSPTTARGEVTASRDEQLSLRALALVDWSQDLKIATDLLHIEAYGSVWDNDGIAQVTLGDAGAIEVHGVDLRGEDGRLTAEGVIAREGTSDFEAHAERLQLAALQPILPEDALRLRGAVGVDLKLSGPAGMPSVNLQLQGAQFVYGDYGPFGLEVGMVVAGGLTTVVANAGGPDIEPLTLQGILPYTINLTDPGFDPDSILQLFAEIPLQDAGNLGHVLPQATSLPPGKFGITLSVGGSGRNPTAVAGLVLRGVDLVGLPPMMADLDGRAEGGQIAVEGRLRDARAQLLGLTLDGDLDLGRWLLDRLGSGEDGDPPGGKPPGPYVANLVTDVDVIGLPVETLRYYTAAVEPFHGKLTGTIRLDGSPFSPRVAADLGLRGGRLGEVYLDRTRLTLGVEQGQAEAGLDVTARGGGTLALAVSSPVDLSFAAARTLEERFGLPGLQGTLLGNDLPFGLLTAFVDGAEDATGSLSATGSVRGTLLDPHPEFDVSMPTGSVCMAPLDVCYEDIELAAHSTLENLELENFEMISRTARIAEDPGGRRNKKGVEKTTGSVHAEGSFALDPDNRGDAVLDVNAKDFWVSDTHRLRLRTDARVSVRGRYPDLRVRGDVEVRELKVEMGDELRRSAFSLERDPRLVVHRGREDVEEEEVESEERIRLTDHLDLRVHVSLDTNCWLFLDVSTLPGLGRIRPDLQLTGDLELAIQQGEMFGDGDVRALRGNLTVLGKQFKVDEGVVTFTGSSPPDPILDVSAIHRSRYGDITITVTGRSRTPTLSFTSDEYDDEADILSILLFGAPMDELRPGSSTDQGDELGILAAMGFAQANQAMAKLFGHSAVDMINLETNPAGPGSYGIEVGKSITDRVFLITRYRFGGVEEDQNVFEAQLEIQITRSLYIEMRYGDAGNGGIEVFWKRKLHNPPSRTKVKTDDG